MKRKRMCCEHAAVCHGFAIGGSLESRSDDRHVQLCFCKWDIPNHFSPTNWSLDPAMKADEIPNKQWAGHGSLSGVCIRLSAPRFQPQWIPQKGASPRARPWCTMVVVATIEIEGRIDVRPT